MVWQWAGWLIDTWQNSLGTRVTQMKLHDRAVNLVGRVEQNSFIPEYLSCFLITAAPLTLTTPWHGTSSVQNKMLSFINSRNLTKYVNPFDSVFHPKSYCLNDSWLLRDQSWVENLLEVKPHTCSKFPWDRFSNQLSPSRSIPNHSFTPQINIHPAPHRIRNV